MLGGRGATAAGGVSRAIEPQARSQPPTHRVPGASIAAKAEEHARRQPQGMGGGSSADGEGYQPVRNGVAPRRGQDTAAEGRPVGIPTANSWAAIAEEDDPMVQDGCGDGDDSADDVADDATEPGDGAHATGRPSGDEDDQHAGGDGSADGELGEQDLRQLWQDYQRACRRMERDSTIPASFVAQARALRDDAERKWRAAKTPQPLSKRMRWAEADLRAAEAKEEAHRNELAQHLEDSARRTRELEARLKVDEDRTARKRAILQNVLAEGVPGTDPVADKARTTVAATAATGIATSIAPQLAAAIERLGTPMDGDTAEGVRQELQLVAVSVANLHEMLKGTQMPSGPLGSEAAHFDISSGDGGGGDDDADGGADDGGGGKRRALSATGNGASAGARWTKTAGGTAWTRRSSSEAAKEEAVRLLAVHAGKAGATAGLGGGGATASSSGRTVPGPAETNDLAEAERRARQAAQLQFHQSQIQQQRVADASTLQQEEQERMQRRQRQEEELRLHQQAIQKAATERAAEEARQRDELISKMSPQELAAAAELHAQHMAVGAQAFGSQAATEMAGMVHQQHARTLAQGSAAGGMQADADALIALSAEELAQWDHEQQSTAGAVPW